MTLSRTIRIGILGWIAGEIDTFGYLALGQVFITHMTGNTGVLAIAIVEGHWSEALHRGLAIPLFFAGAVCGSAIVKSAEDRTQVAAAFLVEALLIMTYASLAWATGGAVMHSPGGWTLMLLLLSAAMGVQNAALTHPGTRGTHNTHITGPLTDLATELIRSGDAERHGLDRDVTHRLLARVIGFAVGALTGAALFSAAPLVPPLVGAAALTLLAAFELRTGARLPA